MRFFLLSALALLLSPLSFGATMKAHFINIGQADATLLEFDCGVVLVDAGAQTFNNAKSTAKLISYLNDFFDSRDDLSKTIDSILITHNHDDHTESLDEC